MLSCQDITELITDYLEKRLSLWDRMRFSMHLGMCKHCRAYVQSQKVTIRAVGALPPEPIPDDMKEHLLECFGDWKKG